MPLVKDIEPPPALFELESARVVGVTLAPELLAEIRQRRVRQMRGSARSYAGLEEVYAELEWAEGVHRRLGCPVIEVSTLAIEETAYRIVRLVERRLADASRPPRSRSRA